MNLTIILAAWLLLGTIALAGLCAFFRHCPPDHRERQGEGCSERDGFRQIHGECE